MASRAVDSILARRLAWEWRPGRLLALIAHHLPERTTGPVTETLVGRHEVALIHFHQALDSLL